MSRRAPSDNREVDSRVVGAMLRAVALATDTQPHPNPRVGAIVLDPAGSEVAVGAHTGPGNPHAEVEALRAAGDRAAGSTVVTTLEPCNHTGRTPPCTEALINAGVARVVVGAVDPDDKVAGRGIAALRAAGVEVIEDVCTAEVIAMDPGYHHHRRTGRPRFRLKLAATLDGQAAARDGSSQWITGEEARRDVHHLRSRADAVMVGAGTLLADDPSLDVRLVEAPFQPRPVVIAGNRPLPATRRLYQRHPLIFVPREVPSAPDGVEIVVAGGGSNVDLGIVAKELAARGLLEVLVEGGPTLGKELLKQSLVDELTTYLGARLAAGEGRPMIAGEFLTLSDALHLDIFQVQIIGIDIRVDATIVEAA